MMSRTTDLRWFEKNRKSIAEDHATKWVVVYDQKVVASFDTEEKAFEYSILQHGVDVASIFFGDTQDPVSFAG